MEKYKGKRTFYVFSRKKKPAIAILEAAREAKVCVSSMEILPVWVDGLNLYLEPTKGAVKMMGVVRKHRK